MSGLNAAQMDPSWGTKERGRGGVMGRTGKRERQRERWTISGCDAKDWSTEDKRVEGRREDHWDKCKRSAKQNVFMPQMRKTHRTKKRKKERLLAGI